MSTITARFGRQPTRGVLLGLSVSRVVCLGVAVFIFVAALIGGGGVGFILGLVAAAPLVVAAYAPIGGRPAIEWAPVASHWTLRRLRHQTTWRARPPQPRPAGTLALPGDAACLRVHVTEDGVAMIHDPSRQTLAAVLRVEHPAFLLLGPDARVSRVGAWGRTVAGLAQSGTCAAIQVLEATVPDSGEEIARWYAERSANTGSWAEAEYSALLSRTGEGATTHRSTITYSLDMAAAGRSIKAAGGGVRGGAQVLQADMRALEHSLRAAELRFGAWASEAEIAWMLRSAYDPALSGAFRPASPGANLAHAGPLALNEQWSSLRHDSGYSAVLWVSEWPRSDTQPMFLHSLVFTSGVRKTLSLIAHPLGTRDALRHIRRERTEMIADQQQKAKIGQIADLSDAQEYADTVAREQSLLAGNADVEFTAFVCVTASDQAELDQAVKQVERAATQAGCETRPLYGAQAQGFVLAALPLGRTSL